LIPRIDDVTQVEKFVNVKENEAMKLKVRMLIVILGSILVILAAMTTYTGLSTNKIAVQSATSLAGASGEKIASSVQKEMENAMDTARTLADRLQGMKNSSMTDRKAVDDMLKKVLVDNPSFLGSWTVWEPNAFDGADAKFKNTQGSDQTGRLLAYWTRNGADISLSAITGYEQQGSGDFYLLARNSGDETVLNPYKYTVGNKEVMMTSLVVPIKKDNKVLGVAGIDITLDQLQKMMTQFKLYDTGYASIFSNDGAILTAPQAEQIGKKWSDVYQDQSTQSIMQSIQAGTEINTKIDGNYKVFKPIQMGRAKTPWAVGISIPMKEITAASGKLLLSNIAAGIVALLLLAGVVLYSTNIIVKPINASVAIGEQIAKGDFTQEVPKRYLERKDEIGALAQVFEEITQSMSAMIGHVGHNASQVAAASQQISASSEELAQGSSLQAESAQTINELFKELSLGIYSVAKSAEQASELTNKTARLAFEGGKVVGE
jgi:methyl-accepting chemotaxis protein